jgi:hypothetical protein
VSKVKMYCCLLAYNSQEALGKWRQEILSEKYITSYRQEHNRLTLRCSGDPYQYPSNDPCYVEWVMVACGNMDVKSATAGGRGI